MIKLTVDSVYTEENNASFAKYELLNIYYDRITPHHGTPHARRYDFGELRYLPENAFDFIKYITYTNIPN